MKTLITAITLAASSIMVTSCANTSTSAATTSSTAASSSTATKPYPLNTCIVTDSKLGSMGDPITKVYNGQEVKFCCAPCVKKFEKNPERYLAKIK